MLKDKVSALLEEALSKEPALFLLDLNVSAAQHIQVTLDGDAGVSLADCMKISRAIEQGLNRDELDFSIEVASPGATAPLQLPRQYTKNIGRKLSVKTAEERLEGQLTAVNGDSITLEWKARETKPVGKGKVTVRKRQVVAFADIDEAKVVLKF